MLTFTYTFPTFTWDEPNIRVILGAVWQHRSKLPRGEWTEPEMRTDVPKQLVRSYRPPANVGKRFYATLRKLGYQKGPDGDYR